MNAPTPDKISDPSHARGLPPDWTLQTFMGGAMALPAKWRGQLGPEIFDSAHATAVTAGGRNAAWYVDGLFGAAVLRHYRRGGLRARLGKQHYFWLGQSRVRSFAEARIMLKLCQAGVPVPAPLAAAYWRSGCLYRAAILVTRIDGARSLAQHWQATDPATVAAAIARMHLAGVWHADLNAWNILLDAGNRVWLIDFDRAKTAVVCEKQMHKNLLRLRRSLVKVAGFQIVPWWNELAQSWHGRLARKR